MKKIWIIFLVLIPFTAISQSSVKVFAYSQTQTPGIIRKGVTDENGNPVNTKKESPVNYYFFAVYPHSASIIFTEIWLKGQFYSVETHKMDSTPVINLNENMPGKPVKEVLVPFTKQQTISIMPIKSMNSGLNQYSWFRNMSRHNELIVSYMYAGKKYFIAVKKIKVLEPVANL